MQYKIPFLSAAASLTLAAPTPADAPADADNYYTWDVTKWTSSCTDTSCSYQFIVCSDVHGTAPGFRAICHGEDDVRFTLCELLESDSPAGDATVFSKLRPALDNPNGGASFRVQVQMTYTDDVTNPDSPATYTYNAHTRATGKKFELLPKKKMSVAAAEEIVSAP